MKDSASVTKKLLAISLPVVLIIAVLALYFNRGYGPVSYPAYQIATALYGASLAKSAPRIDAIEKLLDDGSDKLDVSEITEQERKWLQSIIKNARAKRWEAAASNAKRIMESQNEPSALAE